VKTISKLTYSVSNGTLSHEPAPFKCGALSARELHVYEHGLQVEATCSKLYVYRYLVLAKEWLCWVAGSTASLALGLSLCHLQADCIETSSLAVIPSLALPLRLHGYIYSVCMVSILRVQQGKLPWRMKTSDGSVLKIRRISWCYILIIVSRMRLCHAGVILTEPHRQRRGCFLVSPVYLFLCYETVRAAISEIFRLQCVSKITGPLQLISHNFTNSQRSLIIFGTEWPYSTYGRRAFAVAGPTMFNTLPDDLWDPAVSTSTFRQSLKTHLFSAYQHV